MASDVVKCSVLLDERLEQVLRRCRVKVISNGDKSSLSSEINLMVFAAMLLMDKLDSEDINILRNYRKNKDLVLDYETQERIADSVLKFCTKQNTFVSKFD